MSEFNLGPIRILDNGDEVFRYPVTGQKTVPDKILDPEGKELRPFGREVRNALKQLGLPTLQRLRLSPASRYFTSLAKAEDWAQKGETLQVQENLRHAREAAREAKLSFQEERSQQILRNSLGQELKNLVTRAQALADQGRVEALRESFHAGWDILSRLGFSVGEAEDQGLGFSKDLRFQLERRAMVQAMEGHWEKAERYSREGNVPRTQENLRILEEYARRTQTPLEGKMAERSQDLELRAYRHSLAGHFRQAEVQAQAGDVEKTRWFLHQAQEAAKISKTPLTPSQLTRAAYLENLAKFRSPLILLKQARELAVKGKADQVRELLQNTRDYRAQVGRPLTSEQEFYAKELMQVALVTSVDVLLNQASQAKARIQNNGALDEVYLLINQAKANAALANISLSQAQETSVGQILQEAYQAAVAWRFKQAAASAELGKVDDTLVPLRAARDLAARYRANFDETEAAGLVQHALTQGIELSFQTAEKFAQNGDADNTYFHLETARDYYRRLGLKFDQRRARKILKLLPDPTF